MKKIIHILSAFLFVTNAMAVTPSPGRPKPVTATLVGVCENRTQVLMVAVFTYSNGKVMVVDGQHMTGFTGVQDIIQYAATADEVIERTQTCGTET